MAIQTVNLEGTPIQVTERRIALGKLRLDPNNPRIGLYRDSMPRDTLSDADVMHAITSRGPKAYGKLRDSIEINLGVINPIWVVPEKEDHHLVVEGNTRVLIYRELAEKYPSADEWKAIPAKVLPAGIRDSQINFIRLEAHLRGTTEWDPYERARYLYVLNEEEGYSIPRLGQLTRLDGREIEVEIRAFRDMRDIYHEEFPDDPYEAQKFSYFVEFERSPRVQKSVRSRKGTVADFCQWVGNERIPKAENVRRLPDILSDDTAAKHFLEEGYDKAMEYLAVSKPDLVSPLFQRIEDVIERLKRIEWWQMEEIRSGNQPGQRRLLHDLKETSSAVWEEVSREELDDTAAEE